jgi:arylsulfatase A-like enzyme
MGYRTPNIDRIGHDGCTFTDYCNQQSCRARRAAFITGQNPIRTALTEVATPGLRPEDTTIAGLLKPSGYAPSKFGKNHLGDKDEFFLRKFLPTAYGFDDFFGNLYPLNADEEPEDPDYLINLEFKRR